LLQCVNVELKLKFTIE